MLNEFILLMSANVVLVAAFAWVARLFLKFQIDKDLKRFDRELSDKSERELRIFSASLDAKSKEREIRFSLLYEKRALCISHIYGVLSKAERVAEQLRVLAGVKRWGDLKTMEYGQHRAEELDHQLEELKEYHDDHRIFLDDDLSKGIDSVVNMLQLFSIRYKSVAESATAADGTSFETWWVQFLGKRPAGDLVGER